MNHMVTWKKKDAKKSNALQLGVASTASCKLGVLHEPHLVGSSHSTCGTCYRKEDKTCVYISCKLSDKHHHCCCWSE